MIGRELDDCGITAEIGAILGIAGGRSDQAADRIRRD